MKKTSKNALGWTVVVGVLGLTWLGMMWPNVSRSNGEALLSGAGERRDGREATDLSSSSDMIVNAADSSAEIIPDDKADAASVLDRSPLNNAILFSRRTTNENATAVEKESFGDLWLQDENGVERMVARGVATAKFSPDGRKIAYSNRNGELFVETVDGQELASIPRAFDPSWCSDSASISFLAIPSLDYPELQQRSIYDLQSGEVAQQAAGK